jgi:hypothetical protein
MKLWGIGICILLVLAIVCPPALAINKSDLISFYKGQSVPATLAPTPTPTPQTPSWVVAPTPTPIHQVQPVGSISVISDPVGALVYLDGSFKGFTPITITGVSPTYGYFDGTGYISTRIGDHPHQIKMTKIGYQEYTISDVLVTEGKTTSVSAALTPVSATKTLPITPTAAPTQAPTTAPTIPDSHINPDVIFGSIVKPPINPYVPDLPSKKPNIYLYSDLDLTAQVGLEPEQAITVSEPVYQPGMGWTAEVRNGSLNGAGDFLFYEALVPDGVWQKNEGYVIRAESREQDMTSMLGRYAFNGKETSDFIEYWTSHLVGDIDYVFYPQETGAVDRIMPLSISPEPDEVSRIWFYAEPLVSPPEPVTKPEKIVRDGFYVVEWGVMIR